MAPHDTGEQSALKARLHDDLTAAIRARDEVTMATLRMVLAAITNAEVAGKEARVLSDDEVVTVLAGEAKRRREAAEAFAQGGAPDRAEREQAELAVIQLYLPEALDEAALRALVEQAIAEAAATGRTGPQAMGSVMKTLQPQVRGRADGAQVAALVREALGG